MEDNPMRKIGALCLMVSLVLAGAARAQTRRPRKIGGEIKRIALRQPGAILSFRHRAGATEVTLRGTERAPSAKGFCKVESKAGYLEIDFNYGSITGLVPARNFGKDYHTFVLWAVSLDGGAQNIGEILLDPALPSFGGINTTTSYQTFWLMITAEPDFAVHDPSPMVIMLSQSQENLGTTNRAIPVQGDLIFYTQYTNYASALATTLPPRDTPNELLQARKAVELAAASGILKDPTPVEEGPSADELRAREALTTARDFLAQAEEEHSRSPQSKHGIGLARTATQIAENARALAVGAVGEVVIRQLDRQLVAAEQDLARAQQENEQLKAALAERDTRLAQLRQQFADSESGVARAQGEMQRLGGELLQSRAENERLRAELASAQAQFASLQQRIAGLRDDRERICGELRRQLASLGQLTHRGGRMALTLASDILFDFDKHDLRPVARERLAKVAVLRQLLLPQAAVKYEGHTDLVGSAEYNQWLSEQRALQVYSYQTQQQIELMEEARREFAAQQLEAANQLLLMDFPTSRREATKRSLLLASLADVVEGKSFREPEIPAKGPQEKNRRVVLLFPETGAGQLASVCEQPAESVLPQS